jgi:hypothetical protein
VAETGVPYATAEFYRQMAVTVDNTSKPIAQDTFLALYDNGVNLASVRFAKARYDARVTGLNAYDPKEVERVPLHKWVVQGRTQRDLVSLHYTLNDKDLVSLHTTELLITNDVTECVK